MVMAGCGGHGTVQTIEMSSLHSQSWIFFFFFNHLLACSYGAYLVRDVRKVGHGSGQTALCSQYAGIAGEPLCQDGALDGHLAVAETFD